MSEDLDSQPIPDYDSLYDLLRIKFRSTNETDAILAQKEALSFALSHKNHPQVYTAVSFLLRSKEEELTQMAQDVVVANYDSVVETMDPSNTFGAAALCMMSYFAETKNEKKLDATKTLEKKLPQFVDSLDDTNPNASIIDLAFQFGNEQTVITAEKRLRADIERLGSPLINLEGAFVNGNLVEDTLTYNLLASRRSKTFLKIREAISEHLTTKNLNGYDLMRAWKLSCKDEAIESIITSNLAAINDLERHTPQISKKLNELNGIVNYALYPSQMLLSQFDNVGNKRIFRLASTQQDYNGSGYTPLSVMATHKMYETLRDDVHFEVFEFPVNQTVLPEHALDADCAIIHIHGSPTKFNAGQDDEGKDNVVSIDDIRANRKLLGLSKIKRNGRVILASCESGYVDEGNDGKPNCLGATISELYEIPVCAPQETSGVANLESETTVNGPIIIPTFRTPPERDYNSGRIVKNNYFLNGNTVTKDEFINGIT